jgi:thioredoxin 1
MSVVAHIKPGEFDTEALGHDGLVLVDFTATWCGPCKRLAPELEAAAAELGDKVKIVKVDVDENPEVAMKYGVQGIPNLTLFRGGKVIDGAVGLMPKAQIVALVQRNLGSAADGAAGKISRGPTP